MRVTAQEVGEEMEAYGLHIEGRCHDAETGEWFESVNPFTGEAWARVARGGAADAARAVAAAGRALSDSEWTGMTATQRGQLLQGIGDSILDNVESLARAEIRDNGKAIREMRNSVRTMAQWYHYYGGLADKVEGDVVPVNKPDTLNYTRYQPLGVVAAILPWNSPLRLAAWKIAPALAAGNTMVLKPSEYTSTSLIEFVRLCERAGLPPGVLNVVTGYGPELAEPLISDPRVGKIAFTGGEVAGRAVAELAGRHLKPVSLELGGKSPNIVFEDAEVELAARGLAAGIFGSAGQTCLAGSRAFVHESLYRSVVDRVVEIARAVRLGDPMDESTDVGPVATRPQFEKILAAIAAARHEGATVLTGGRPVTMGEARFVEPTVIVDVDNSMSIAQQEVFGPVLAVIPFRDESDAVAMANDSAYGLAAGVWTRDVRRAHRVADSLESGTVWINTYRNTFPQSPFGGVKRSGIGRESGAEMIREYLQVKSIWLDLSGEFPLPFGPA